MWPFSLMKRLNIILWVLTALAFFADVLLTVCTCWLYLVFVPTKKMLGGRVATWYCRQVLKLSNTYFAKYLVYPGDVQEGSLIHNEEGLGVICHVYPDKSVEVEFVHGVKTLKKEDYSTVKLCLCGDQGIVGEILTPGINEGDTFSNEEVLKLNIR